MKRLSGDAAELTRVYVRPAFRGNGLGKAIVDAVIASARQEGYATARLETAIFMTDARTPCIGPSVSSSPNPFATFPMT